MESYGLAPDAVGAAEAPDLSTWLNAWRNREKREPTGPVMELLVVAGADAGNQFTIEGDEVLLGRGKPESGQTDSVRLEDKSISRRQAFIRRDASGTSIEHIETAANPTFLNGREIGRAKLAVGDRIDMGRISIDVRVREGMNLRGLTQIMEVAARESTMSGLALPEDVTAPPPELETTATAATEIPAPAQDGGDIAVEVTDIRPMDLVVGELTILRGADEVEKTSYPLFMGDTTIGRGAQADIQIPELGVSRLHAEIAISSRGMVIRQRSQTNPTLLNGFPVLEEVVLGDGDEIQLADRVVLGVRLSSAANRPDRSSGGLSRSMQNKIDLDRRIEEFSVMGSFLDVDVVASRTMKGGGEKAEHIIVSFERFRAYVAGICEEMEGQVLNSNGDELMCFFESASSAVLAGSAILERLADFNRDLNLLSKEFSFRLGAHTGMSLVDLDAGVAYSEVLDTAGHIQKLAEPDTLVISQTTLESIPKRIPVTSVGELTGEGRLLYRVDRFLRRADCELAPGEEPISTP